MYFSHLIGVLSEQNLTTGSGLKLGQSQTAILCIQESQAGYEAYKLYLRQYGYYMHKTNFKNKNILGAVNFTVKVVSAINKSMTLAFFSILQYYPL